MLLSEEIKNVCGDVREAYYLLHRIQRWGYGAKERFCMYLSQIIIKREGLIDPFQFVLYMSPEDIALASLMVINLELVKHEFSIE